MRRSGPRPLAAALEDAVGAGAPQTLLARVQAAWPEVAGATLEREATPVSERAGEVAMACRAATWAHELGLLEPDLRTRLNVALGGDEHAPVRGLKFAYRRGP